LGELTGLTEKFEILGLRLRGFSAEEAQAAVALQKQMSVIAQATPPVEQHTAAVTAGTTAQVEMGEALARGGREAQAAAAKFDTLRDAIVGADLPKEMKQLEAVWASLTPAQRANEEVVKRVSEAYLRLRNEGAGTVATFEALTPVLLATTAAVRDVEQAARIAAFGYAGMADGLENLGTKVDAIDPKIIANRKAIADIEQATTVAAFGYKATQTELLRVGETVDLVEPQLRGIGDTFKSLSSLDFGAVFTDITSFFRGGAGQIGTGFLEGLGSQLLTGVTSFFAGPLSGIVSAGLAKLTSLALEGAKKLGEAVWNGLKSIGGAIAGLFGFGGPSGAQLQGREDIKAFESELAGLLTAQQRADAGGESWKMTVIAIRDAYRDMGRSEAEALADTEKLWKSAEKGPQAVSAAIAEIEQRMTTELVPKTQAALDELTSAAVEAGAVIVADLGEAPTAAVEAEFVAMQRVLDQQFDQVLASSEATGDDLSAAFEKSAGDIGSEFTRLRGKLGRDLDGVSDAAVSVSDRIQGVFSKLRIQIPVGFDVPNLPGMPSAPSLPGFATGTPRFDFAEFGRESLITMLAASKTGP
jgi:hypothetical protein